MKKPSPGSQPAPHPRTLEDVNNVELVVLAAYLLGGTLRMVETEDIAMKAHQMAPLRFAWRKYPEQIDIERVRVRLSQAKHESLLSGVHSKGWRLTANGTLVVEDNLLVLAGQGSAKASVRKSDRQWIASEKKRLLATPAYKKFAAGRSTEISKIEIQDFFRVDEYMNPETRKIKLDRLLGAFRSDKALGELIEALILKTQIGS